MYSNNHLKPWSQKEVSDYVPYSADYISSQLRFNVVARLIA
jgi:hypothetical protein